MSRAAWREHISVEPDVHHGVPCIKGTRIPVSIVLGSLADGMSAQDIMVEYPQLAPEDISAVLSYAADAASEGNGRSLWN